MIYIDQKYVHILSSQLEGFRQMKPLVFNARCPICGDSKKNKYKKRFYIYPNTDRTNLFVKCHNCSFDTGINSFSNFLKEYYPDIYKNYIFEIFKEKDLGKKQAEKKVCKTPKKEKKINNNNNKYIQSLNKMPAESKVIQYLINRKIPVDTWKYLLYTPNFSLLCRQYDENFPDTFNDERLVIPFINEDKKMVCFQGRALEKNAMRYATFKIYEDEKKLFGAERINKNNTVNVVEGPFDSLFIDNCVATADSCLFNYQDGDRYIFDNQPRNKELIQNIKKTINLGKSVVIWPDYIKAKDINDIILSGIDRKELQNIIEEHTYKGNIAKLMLSKWKQI